MSGDRIEIRLPWFHIWGESEHNTESHKDKYEWTKHKEDIYLPMTSIQRIEKHEKYTLIVCTNGDLWMVHEYATKCI